MGESATVTKAKKNHQKVRLVGRGHEFRPTYTHHSGQKCKNCGVLIRYRFVEGQGVVTEVYNDDGSGANKESLWNTVGFNNLVPSCTAKPKNTKEEDYGL